MCWWEVEGKLVPAGEVRLLGDTLMEALDTPAQIYVLERAGVGLQFR